MTIISTLLNQKTHIIYGIVIVLIASVAYHFFKKDPEVITKTLTKLETKIQTVEKVVTKDKIVYVTRTITTHKKNGDVVVEVDHEHDTTQVHSQTNSKTTDVTKLTEKTVESFMKNYSIEALFPVLNNSLSVNTNPLDTEIVGGMRIFSTPIFVEAGTTMHFNQVLIGLRLEF